jgi:hypothetical protein
MLNKERRERVPQIVNADMPQVGLRERRLKDSAPQIVAVERVALAVWKHSRRQLFFPPQIPSTGRNDGARMCSSFPPPGVGPGILHFRWPGKTFVYPTRDEAASGAMISRRKSVPLALPLWTAFSPLWSLRHLTGRRACGPAHPQFPVWLFDGDANMLGDTTERRTTRCHECETQRLDRPCRGCTSSPSLRFFSRCLMLPFIQPHRLPERSPLPKRAACHWEQSSRLTGR